MPEKFPENKTIKLWLPFPSQCLFLVNTISNDQGSMDCILYLHDIINQALRTCLVKCPAGFPISPCIHLSDGTLGNYHHNFNFIFLYTSESVTGRSSKNFQQRKLLMYMMVLSPWSLASSYFKCFLLKKYPKEKAYVWK